MAKKLAQIVSTQAFSPVSDVKGGIVITRDGRSPPRTKKVSLTAMALH